jgi:RNA polymerase sigma factor (sigma-70 family)
MPTPVTTDAAAPAGWPPSLVDQYRRDWADLTRLGYLLTGNRAVAEELVQDVFVAVRTRWDRIDNPGGYLRTSLVNAARDWGRHQQVVRRHEPTAPEALRAATSEDHPDELWDALGRLDGRRRQAVVLRFYLDLPDGEIAELIGCRPATVRTLIHRALRDLRREMTP